MRSTTLLLLPLHHEKETGSVDVGKLADLVVLDRNLFEESPASLSQARVLRTFVEDEEVTAPGAAGDGDGAHGAGPATSSPHPGGGA